MKKSFFLIPVLSFLISTSAFAQFDQGMMQIGAGIFAIPQYNSVEVTTRVNVGYFIMDNVAVGLLPHFSRTVRGNSNDLTDVINNAGISLYGRYYFTFPFSDRFAAFPEISAGPGTRGYKGNSGLSLNLTAGAGANYFFSDNVAVEVVLPIVHNRNLTDNGISSHVSISPVIGLQYHF